MRVATLFSLVIFAQGCPEPPAFCGDGALNEGEECDDGNNTDADGCHTDCVLPACGDGVKDPGEICLLGPSDLTTDTAPQDVATADIDGDGLLDIATANSGDSLSVFLGGGDGSFLRVGDVELQGAAAPIAIADIDGDGAQDLATSLFSGPDEIPVFRGVGDGSFAPLVTLPAGISTTALVPGDFNGDTQPDLVGGDGSGGGILLFLNSGEGGFVAPRFFAVGRDIAVLETGDFNADGALDLVGSVPDADALLFLLGDGAGNFLETLFPLSINAPVFVTSGDLNGDGALDIAVASSQARTVSVLLGNGLGEFTESDSLAFFAPTLLVVADFNADELPDLAVIGGPQSSDLKASLAVFAGDGTGAFSALASVTIPLDSLGPTGVAVADFNTDALPDLAISDQFGARVQILLSAP